MHRFDVRSFLSRLFAIILALFLLGLGSKLVSAVLSPVLPPILVQALGSGWELLLQFTGTALPAIAAIAILGALLWIFLGKR